MKNRYRRGADFERELVSMFWDHGWSALRAAGSGTTTYPVPDVVAFSEKHALAVECKTTGKDRLSLRKAVLALQRFLENTRAIGVIAVKFLRKEPRFYTLDMIERRGNYTIHVRDPYLSFDALVGAQKRLVK
ncbi:Holliday junction resolvase Hjc [Candidatus Altiarchaeota archaeon]